MLTSNMPARAHTLTAAIVSLAFASISLAAQPPNPKDLTQGHWELSLEKSHFCTPAPRKSVRDIIDAGYDLIAAHATGVGADGKPIDFRYVWRYDGKMYPANIDRPANEAIRWKLVDPHKVEFNHVTKADVITQKLVRTVSDDGQVMTQTTEFVGGKGGKANCVDTQVFVRK